MAEYEALKVLPESDRAERAPQFWTERTKQRKEIATVAALVLERVFQEPDATEESLLALVREFSEDIRLAPYQEKIARDLIHASRKRRLEILQLRKQYPEDTNLLRRAHPRGTQGSVHRVSAVVRPLTIHFRVNEKTYQQMCEKTNAEKAGGFFEKSGKLFTYQRGIYERESTLLHEEMHALYDFFKGHLSKHLHKSLFLRPEPSMDRLQKRIRAEGVSRPLRDHLTELLHASADRIKDELFAFSRAATKEGKISSYLLQPKDKQGLYDYFDRALTFLTIAVAAYTTSEEDYRCAREMIEEEFPKMHRRLIEDGLSAMKTLSVHKKWTFMEVAFFFVDVPLERWPDEIRLLQHLEDLG